MPKFGSDQSAQVLSLSALIDALDHVELDCDFGELFEKARIPSSDLDEYVNFSDLGYTRNLVKKTPRYELLVLCWKPGQESPIHCHNGSRGWMLAVEGKVHEYLYQLQEKGEDIQLLGPKKACCTAKAWAYIDDERGVHRVACEGKKPAITLHLYSPPIQNFDFFVEEGEKLVKKNFTYPTSQAKKAV